MKKRVMIAMCMVLVAVVCVMKFSGVKAANAYKSYDEFQTAVENAADIDAAKKVFDNLDEGSNGDLHIWIVKPGKHRADFVGNILTNLEIVSEDPSYITFIQKIIDTLHLYRSGIPAANAFLLEEFSKPLNTKGAMISLLDDKKNADLIIALLDKNPNILFEELGGKFGNLNPLALAMLNVADDKVDAKVLAKMADIWQKATKEQQEIKFVADQFLVDIGFASNKGDIFALENLFPSKNIVLNNGKTIQKTFVVAEPVIDIVSIEELGKGLHDVAK